MVVVEGGLGSGRMVVVGYCPRSCKKKKKKKTAKVRRGESVYLDIIVGRKKEGRVLHVHIYVVGLEDRWGGWGRGGGGRERCV